ncbi:MAG: flavin reductase family protein [Methanomassiliicoccales archaeon]
MKKSIGKCIPPLALPVCLVGAVVKGKPNFCTVAWFTMIDDEPPTLGLVMAKNNRTKDGINENRAFSVNIPNRDLVKQTDWCGLHSGHNQDKSKVFSIEFGEITNAPLISNCPISVECRLKRIIDLEGVDLVLGTIESVYVEEKATCSGKIEPMKIDPLILWTGKGWYLSLGEKIADAYSIGKEYQPPS